MLPQQCDILENIALVQKSQATLFQTPQNNQQEFFHLWAHRHLIKQNILHKNINKALGFLPGTFSNSLLNHKFMSSCIQNKLQLSSEDYPILQKLIHWAELYPTLKSKSTFNFMQVILDKTEDAFENIYSLITYINIVSPDILKLLRKKGKFDQNQAQKVQNYNIDLLNAEDVLKFLNIVLPKILYNILLPSNILPKQKKKDDPQSFQSLYKISSLQYYLKTKTNYTTLVRILIRILLQLQLKLPQQKNLMEIIFNYFYVYHHEKKNNATDFFIQAYNKLNQSTRFALSDQFLLFFRIAKKIGKAKFVNFLIEKSSWLKQMVSKITDNNLIGYPKDTLSPFTFHQIIGQNFVVNNGEKQYRYFEIFQDFSLFYFKINIKSLDITVKLYYLGQYNSKAAKVLLFQNQKKSGELINNVVAAKRGLYLFQFDNSYSWINKKTIRYQNIILSPLQIKSPQPIKWLPSFYQNIQGNQVSKEAIILLQKPQKREQNKKYDGIGNILKLGPFYNLKLNKGGKIYEFETQNEEKLIKKFNELLKQEKNIKWQVDSQPLQNDQYVFEKIKNYNGKKEEKGKRQSSNISKETQKLDSNFDEGDEIDIQRPKISQRRKQKA